MFKDQCKETYEVSLKYLGEFFDAYGPKVPKFSVVWLSYLGHDDINGLYRADNDFAKFFVKYEDELKNSFVFFMGDHGLRWSGQ